MSEYATGPEKLVVYTDVPNHATAAPMVTVKPGINPQNEIPLKLKSDIFEIRVKSAATDGQWVQCFTNYTYNRGSEIEDIDRTDGTNSAVVIQNYQNLTSGWTHSYANVETTTGSLVEVEISLIGSTQLNGKNFIEKFAVHPFDKASNARLEAGKIYFTIDKPGQVVIDINGQMDDHNAAINPMAGNPPAHGISFFANPILTKPAASGPGIVTVAPGTPAPDPSTFDTLIFQPGVHVIGKSYPLHPGKSYYIPGDTVLIGTFSNLLSTSGSNRTKGDAIRMFGYGTINGAIYTHYLYPGYVPGPTEFSDRVIVIEEGVSCELFGLTITDPSNHSQRLFSWSGADQPSDTSYKRWIKSITWRANGDGLGGSGIAEDCFLRTADDSTYTGNHKRAVFWKDVNAALVHMPDIPSGTTCIEDCDVIYNRLRDPLGNNGGGFQLRDGGRGVLTGDMVIRNVRFLDKRSNMSAINFDGRGDSPGIGTSFKSVRFENVSIEPPIANRKQRILGDATAPWFGGLTFKNVSFGGVSLTAQNFDTYFTRNEWVDYLLFDDPVQLDLTTSANALEGEIRRNPSASTYTEMSPVILTAVPKAGQYVFSHWSGDASGTQNPLTVWMNSNKIVSANFRLATISEAVVITAPDSGTWTVPPGVFSMTLDAWGGGGAGGSAYNGATSGTNTQARGGGGAGGSFASRTLRVTPGQVISYTVGAGGIPAEAGFTHNSNANPGGTSSAVVNAQSTTAVGGPGGTNVSVSNQNISGTGGIAPTSGNSGTVIHYGGSGANANSNGTGGGGGSAGPQGPGGIGAVVAGGAAGLGGGAVGGTGHNSTKEGQSAETPGAGGSGAGVRSDSFNHRTGGKGADGRIMATYNTMSFTLTTNVSGIGAIQLDSPGGVYPSGATAGVTAVAPPGYLFTEWGGALSGSTNPTTILMDDDKSITASFVLDPEYGNLWDSGGTADGSGNFNWSDAANWLAAVPTGGNLIFSGSLGTTAFNDLAADTLFTGIRFNSTAAAFLLNGNRIALGGNVVNESGNLQTINLPVILSPTRSFDASIGDFAIGGVLSGTGGFVKTGSGSLTLFAANTYTGTAAIQNGTVILSGGNDRLPVTNPVSLGTAAPTSTLGILQLGDANGPVNQTVTAITIPAGDSGGSNRVVGGNSAQSTITINNTASTSFNGTLGGPGTHQNNLALIKSGAGNFGLRGASTFIGPTWIQNGTLEIANGNNRLPVTTALTLGSGTTSGVLQLGNTTTARSQTVASLSISGSGTNNRVVGAHLTNFPVLTVNNTADVIYDGFLGGPTGGQNRLNLVKNGSGKIILSGASGPHTYIGSTTVNNGALLIHSHSPLATGLVSVVGGILGGSGTIGGSVTVAAAGSISPGSSAAGTFTLGGDLDISAMANGGSGKLNYKLGPISSSDKIVVGGALTIGPADPSPGVLGFSDFSFTALSGLENGTYKLITSATSIVGALDPVLENRSGPLGSGNAQGILQFTGNDLELLVTGIGPGPVDKFVISLISSPQTVGTPITGITITAQDAANNTATGFTGTVTFGGSGGFSGTSATFSEGVLSGVSITPTVSGSDLTFTVNDGASQTGAITIATIQTQYQAWAGASVFDEDANNDGVKNGLAWLLGASSPTVHVNLPTVTQGANGLTLTFNMLNLAVRGTAGLKIEHSSDLGSSDAWTAVTVPEATSATPDHGITFVITPDGNFNQVTATVANSEADGGKLFGRLAAEE